MSDVRHVHQVYIDWLQVYPWVLCAALFPSARGSFLVVARLEHDAKGQLGRASSFGVSATELSRPFPAALSPNPMRLDS